MREVKRQADQEVAALVEKIFPEEPGEEGPRATTVYIVRRQPSKE